MFSRSLLICAFLSLTVILNVSAQPVTTDAVAIVHLLNRAGYGPRPGDVERVQRIGIAAYLDQQLQPDKIDDSAVEARLSTFDTLTSDTAAIRARYRNDPRPVVEQLQGQKIIRAIYSDRQLQEVMTDFWFNHFNVDASKAGVEYSITSYERDAIRPYALGKFKDLLNAVAKHPAMLSYLDNAKSSAAGINENYARELMELHTMGVDGGYLQADVEAVARCLSGWTLDSAENFFQFRDAFHTPGSKVVLGQTIPSGGIDEGEAVLAILAKHPSTARFIAAKLVRRFVDDNPPPALVDKVTKTFAEADGDTSAMLRTIFNSEEFLSSKAIRSKLKTPFELVASAMRGVNAELQSSVDSQSLQGALRGLPQGDIVLTKSGGSRVRVSPAVILTRTIQEMGQFPYQNPEPTGYADSNGRWMSDWAVLRRTNFAVALLNNQIFGTVVDVPRLAATFNGDPSSKDAWKTALDAVIAPVIPEGTTTSTPPDAIAEAFVLALGSPGFQRR